MIRNWRFAALAALAFPATVVAQESAAPKPDLAKAQQTATQVCAACHGADGNSATAANPNLAGQHADYITVQLAHFKAGIRVNPIMQGMAATLSDADMRALGIYFSQQKPKGLTSRWRKKSSGAAIKRTACLPAPPVIRRRAPAFQRIIRASEVNTPTTPMRNCVRSRTANAAPTRPARMPTAASWQRSRTG